MTLYKQLHNSKTHTQGNDPNCLLCQHILAELAKQQNIQMQHRPNSVTWQDASKRIHELAEQLTGKKPEPARGK